MSGTDSGISIPHGASRTLQPNERLTVTLEAQQWNQVLALLSDVAAPLRITQPLVQAIATQCMNPRTAELHALRPAVTDGGNEHAERQW